MTVEAGTDDEGEQIPVAWFDGKELKRAEICGLCLDQF